MIQQFASRLPSDAPVFYSLRAGLVSRLQMIDDTDFNAFISLTQEVIDLDNMFRQSAPPRPTGNRDCGGRNQPNRPPTTTQSQQPQQPLTAPTSQSHAGQTPVIANPSRDNGCGGRRNDNPNRDQRSGNQAFLATMLSEPAPSVSDPPPESLSPHLSPDDPVAFLASPDSAPVVNEDVQADFYDPLAFAALSPELSNALALISVSSGPKAKLNTILDSGSTHHIFRDRSAFRSYNVTQDVSVKTANCGSLVALGVGTVVMVIRLAGRRVELILPNCLHAPDVPINLFSVGDLQENGFRIHFEPGTTTPYTDIIFPSTHAALPGFHLKAEFINRLSFLSCDFDAAVAMPAVAPGIDRFPPVSITPSLWHRRLGHPHLDVTRAVLTKDYAAGVDFTGTFDRAKCVPCLIGKSPQQPYSHNGHRAQRLGELLHMDTCGPFPVATPHGKKYFSTVLDDCSNFGFTSLGTHKLDAVDSYLATEAHIERLSSQRVLSVHVDNAPEFVAGRLGSHFRNRGIMVQAIAPYAHSQNGKVEHYIRTLEDGLQTLLADSGLPNTFWGDAVLTVQYLRNRLPTSTLPANVTPFEAFYGKKPDLSHLRVWGCQCFAIVAPELRKKGGPRRMECIFVGYDEFRIGWWVRDLKGTYHFSRDVIFNESLNARLGSPSSHPLVDRINSVTGHDYSSALDLISNR